MEKRNVLPEGDKLANHDDFDQVVGKAKGKLKPVYTGKKQADSPEEDKKDDAEHDSIQLGGAR